MSRAFFNEMYEANGSCRPHYQEFARWLANTPLELLEQRRREADLLFHRAGITFTLYGDSQDTERLIPFDIIPRSIRASEWRTVERGCIQRVQALNLFLQDIYHDQRILKAGIIPPEQVLANEGYQIAMQGLDLHRGLYAHIAGVDLVRDGDGSYFVLEDNLRTPSGVSYMLEDRKMMMRLFPELFAAQRIAPIDHYPNLLLDTLKSASPLDNPLPCCSLRAVSTAPTSSTPSWPGKWASSWSKARDLFVRDEHVYMRTTAGPQQVDVIYRRLDDDYLDPLSFNPDSTLGVPGLISVYRAGNVVLANAVGTGVADDQVDLPVCGRHDPFLPERRADPQQRAHLAVPANPQTCPMSWPTCPSWWSRKLRAPAAMACWWGRHRPAPRSRISGRVSKPARTPISRNPPCACRPAPPSSTAASRRATSTCARSCYRAVKRAWCLAA